MTTYDEMTTQLANEWVSTGLVYAGNDLEDNNDFKDFCDQNMDIDTSIQAVISNHRLLADIWHNFLSEVQSCVYSDVIEKIRQIR